MRHPFDFNSEELQSLALDSLQDLTDSMSESIGGGQAVSQTFTAVGPGESGESGGGGPTTLAWGEGGGQVSTQAVGEEGGHVGGFPIPSWLGQIPGGSGGPTPL